MPLTQRGILGSGHHRPVRLGVAVNAPCVASRRKANNWFGAMPCRRATRLTVNPGSCVSATIANFSAGVLWRLRSGPTRTSLFRLLLVRHDNYSYLLSKWEDVSGQIGAASQPSRTVENCGEILTLSTPLRL